MPGATEATVPLPEPPELSTLSVCVLSVKVAVTACAPAMVTSQVVAIPLHPPPLQPVKSLLASGDAVSVTMVL